MPAKGDPMIDIRLRFQPVVALMAALVVALSASACGGTDNLTAAMSELGLRDPETPAPLNLFMNIPWTEDGRLMLKEPVTKRGDHVVFRAEMDVVVAFSACPQDILPINGRARHPTEAHFQVLSDILAGRA